MSENHTSTSTQQAFQWPQLPTEPHITAGPVRSQALPSPVEAPSNSPAHDKALQAGVGVRVSVCVGEWVGLIHRLDFRPRE